VTSVFKIRFKKFANFTKFLKFVKFVLSHCSLTAKFYEFAQQIAVVYTEATVEWEQWAVMIEDCDSDTGEDSEAAGDS